MSATNSKSIPFPIKISLICSFTVCVALIFLNIHVSQQYKNELVSKAFLVKDRVIAETKEQLSSNAEPVKILEALFGDFSAGSDKYVGVSRIEVSAVEDGVVLYSTAQGKMGKPVSEATAKMFQSYKSLREKGVSYISDDKTEDDSNTGRIFFFDRYSPQSGGEELNISVVVDLSLINGKVSDFSFLMLIISVFLVLIIFVTVFLISGRISMNIKLISNAIDSLALSHYDITLPQSHDELGDLCLRVNKVKDVLVARKEELKQLESAASMMNNRKFEAWSEPANSEEGNFYALIRIIGVHKHFETLKLQAGEEIAVSLTEFINDNIVKQRGRLLSFGGSSFIVAFPKESGLKKVKESLQGIRQKLSLFCSQLDISASMAYRLKAVIMEGRMFNYHVRSGTLDFKAIIGILMQQMEQVIELTGTGEIIFAEQKEVAHSEYSLDPDLKSLEDAPEFKELKNGLNLFLLPGKNDRQLANGKAKKNLSQKNGNMQISSAEMAIQNTPVQDIKRTIGGIASMLEDTLKS